LFLRDLDLKREIVQPNTHVSFRDFTELEPTWFHIADDVPRMTKAMLTAWRRGERDRPED
jgi:hypothetical protein